MARSLKTTIKNIAWLKLPICILVAGMFWIGNLFAAVQIDNFSASINDRFANSSNFIADSFDLSGIAISDSGGNWATLVSNNIVLSANHYNPSGDLIRFYSDNDPNGDYVDRTVVSGQKIGSTDLWIGVLDESVSSNITYYDFATETLTTDDPSDPTYYQYSRYGLENAYLFGRSPSGDYGDTITTDMAVGRNRLDLFGNINVSGTVASAWWAIDNLSTDSNYVDYETYLQGGDSSGPMFVDIDGEFVLVGINWANGSVDFGGGVTRNVSFMSYVGNYSDQIQSYIDSNLAAYPASLSINDSVPLEVGESLNITNAAAPAGEERASAKVASIDSPVGWSVDDLSLGDLVAPDSTISGTLAFDSTGLLNGTYGGNITIGMENNYVNDPNTSYGDLIWELMAVIVEDNTGSGLTAITAGADLSDYDLSLSSDGGSSTAELLAGTVSENVNIEMDFNSFTGTRTNLLSDVLTLTGLLKDELFVLQMNYDPSAGTPEYLAWWDEDGWVNAILGNSDGGSGAFFIEGAYDGDLTLSHYGVDTENYVAWAVLDHNSNFSVFAIPEPATLVILLLGYVGLACRRNFRG